MGRMHPRKPFAPPVSEEDLERHVRGEPIEEEPVMTGNARDDEIGSARMKLGRVVDGGRAMIGEMTHQLRRRPVATLGVVAGAGFVLGALFGSKLVRNL